MKKIVPNNQDAQMITKWVEELAKWSNRTKSQQETMDALASIIYSAISEERKACATLARKILEGNEYPDTALEAEARILARGGVE